MFLAIGAHKGKRLGIENKEMKDGIDGVELLLPVKGGGSVANPIALETGIPGIFAGADAVTGPDYVIDAFVVGRKAAISIDRYIRGENLFTGKEGEGSLKSSFKVDIEGSGKKPRQSQPILSLDQGRGNFVEVEQGFSMDLAKRKQNVVWVAIAGSASKP